MTYWAVAMTKSCSENITQFNLNRQEFETYLPKYLIKVGKEFKIKILFPRYIFVKIKLQWHSINGTRGIIRLIMNETKPAQISERIIHDLKSREDSKGMIVLPSAPKFTSGQAVRVVKGPLEGYIGLYEGMRPNERIRVLIQMLGQTVPIELDEKDLMAVASPDEKVGV